MVLMMVNGTSCCVCGERDTRALVEVYLLGGKHATLCGTHALMHRRSRVPLHSESELRNVLADRRSRRDRRKDGDELGAALVSAFSGEKRERDRRRA